MEQLSGDICTFIAGQKVDCFSNIFGVSGAAHWNLLAQLTPFGLGVASHYPRSGGKSGSYNISPHAERRCFYSHRFGKSYDGCLSRCISRPPTTTGDSEIRGSIDDDTLLSRFHRLKDGLATKKCSFLILTLMTSRQSDREKSWIETLVKCTTG